MIKGARPAAGPPGRVPLGSGRRPKAHPPGYAKIHVDADIRAGRGKAAAAICRDRGGSFLGSSALVISGVDDPATVEAIACGEALALTEDLNIHQFIVSSDSKQVIGDITNNGRDNYRAIISEITSRASLFHCNFIFEGRAVT